MKFTGKDLELVREALSLAVDEVHNQIATCPDVFEYADELDELRQKKAQLKWLLEKVSK